MLFRWLALGSAVLTWPLIAFGAFVRLKGAGLACPDWPLCYGNLIPPPGYEIALEVGHRFVATLLGLLIIALVILTHTQPKLKRYRGIAWLSLVLVVVQGVLGGLTVLMTLWPPVVVFHLVGGNLCFAVLVYLAVITFEDSKPRAPSRGFGLFQESEGSGRPAAGNPSPTNEEHSAQEAKSQGPKAHSQNAPELGSTIATSVSPEELSAGQKTIARTRRNPELFRRAWIMLGIFFVILTSGGANSTTYSGYSCEAFPGCHHGSFMSFSLEEIDKEHAIPIPPELEGHFLPRFQNEWIHMIHRAIAIGGALILVWMLVRWMVHRQAYRTPAISVMVLLALEIGVGIINALYRIPVPVSALHTAIAALIVGILTFMLAKSNYES